MKSVIFLGQSGVYPNTIYCSPPLAYPITIEVELVPFQLIMSAIFLSKGFLLIQQPYPSLIQARASTLSAVDHFALTKSLS